MCSAWLRGARHRVSPHYFLRRPLCPTAFPSGTVAAWPRAVAQRLCSFMCATLASLCGVKRRWRARALFAFVRATSRKSAERRNKRSRSALFARYMTSRRRVCRAAGTAVALGCICAALGSALDTRPTDKQPFCRFRRQSRLQAAFSRAVTRSLSRRHFDFRLVRRSSYDAIATTTFLRLHQIDALASIRPAFLLLPCFLRPCRLNFRLDRRDVFNERRLHSIASFVYRLYSTLLDFTRLYSTLPTTYNCIASYSVSPFCIAIFS